MAAMEELVTRKRLLGKSLPHMTELPGSKVNRPFYRYGGHIELIRFKEYYRMPRGHEHILFVFSSAFRDIFSFLGIRF